MKTSTLLAGAALAGLLTGSATTARAATDLSAKQGLSAAGQQAGVTADDKHDCKGQNACKGKGGCKSGDNGCKGKNSCKGKGGCKSDHK